MERRGTASAYKARHCMQQKRRMPTNKSKEMQGTTPTQWQAVNIHTHNKCRAQPRKEINETQKSRAQRPNWISKHQQYRIVPCTGSPTTITYHSYDPGQIVSWRKSLGSKLRICAGKISAFSSNNGSRSTNHDP